MKQNIFSMHINDLAEVQIAMDIMRNEIALYKGCCWAVWSNSELTEQVNGFQFPYFSFTAMCFYRNVTVVYYHHGVLDLVLAWRDFATSQSSFIISSYMKTEIHSASKIISVFCENLLSSKAIMLTRRSFSQDEIQESSFSCFNIYIFYTHERGKICEVHCHSALDELMATVFQFHPM
jgi:hypothetical protein